MCAAVLKGGGLQGYGGVGLVKAFNPPGHFEFFYNKYALILNRISLVLLSMKQFPDIYLFLLYVPMFSIEFLCLKGG